MYRRIGQVVLGLVVIATAALGGWGLFIVWNASRAAPDDHKAHAGDHAEAAAPVQTARLSPQAQKNLELVARPLRLTTFWKTIDVPGVVVDRPGISDRGVVAPVSGVITKIHHYPGDTIAPGAPLFAVRLVSETLHASQLELFKATREIDIAEQQKARLAEVAQSGALAQSRIIEIDNQIRRLEVTVQAYQQDLQARGLPSERIAAAARGEFISEFTINAPSAEALKFAEIALTSANEPLTEPGGPPFAFELQELKVELGMQVETGHVLCTLADHRSLLIEGHGFKQDMPLIQEAARNGWEIDAEFELSAGDNWPRLPAKLRIDHVANTIDVESRTFSFYLPLENQWRAYERNGQTRLLWRFRPGDRVRLHVAVEKLENVFVLPQAALVREGPEAFVFRQNGELFDRKAVQVLHEDRRYVVIANGGNARPGFYIAQNGAASINRVLKAQSASGTPNVHVHADGTVHAAH